MALRPDHRAAWMRCVVVAIALLSTGLSVIAQEEEPIHMIPFDGTDPSPGGPFGLSAWLGADVPPNPIDPVWDLTVPTAPSATWSSADNNYQFGFALGTDEPGDWVTRFNTGLQAGPDVNGEFKFLANLNEVSGIEPTPFRSYLVTLQVQILDGSWDLGWVGFNPQPEPPPDVMPLLGYNFDVLPASPTRVRLTLSVQNQDTGDLVSFVQAPLPGDTDGDGDIDDSDLGTSFANYTGPVGDVGKTAAQGDNDKDGDVDDSDLGTSFAYYTGPVILPAAPEPTSLTLLLVGVGILNVGRNAYTRRRRMPSSPAHPRSSALAGSGTWAGDSGPV